MSRKKYRRTQTKAQSQTLDGYARGEFVANLETVSALKLGEILVKQGVIQKEQLSKALDEQKKTGAKLTMILGTQGVKEPDILKALEKEYKIPSVDLGSFQIPQTVLDAVPRELCEKNLIIPVNRVAGTLVVAFSDPSKLSLREDLRFLTRSKIQVVVASERAIQEALEKYHGPKVQDIAQSMQDDLGGDDIEVANQVETIDSDASANDEPIIKFVNAILMEAVRKKASDIHFEPYEKKFRVRYRVDGNMIEAATQPNTVGPALSSRLKIMAKLDIAERRRPQDGRIKVKYKGGMDIDFRVSVLPTMWGEKVVLRLLDKSNLQLDMTKLGFEPEDLAIFKSVIKTPQGLILITGPTGSGKTTTIYSALAELNQPDVNISTAEDPVEFNLDGINQVQMNPDIDLNFANALRSFLRQDPDIIMVGEIRDLETAEISMKAASTGHLVVSTLHTNDAPQTINRLVDMGIPPYILTSTVSLIVAQRLVGRICESCKTKIDVKPEVLVDLGVDPKDVDKYSNLYKGTGCATCNKTGIKGRLAIFEVMQMTDGIRECILRGGNSLELRSLARQEGMRTLRRSALLKLQRGETTIEEVVNTSVKDTA